MPNGEKSPFTDDKDSNPIHEILSVYQWNHMGHTSLAEGAGLHFIAVPMLKAFQEKGKFTDLTIPKNSAFLDIMNAADGLVSGGGEYLPDLHDGDYHAAFDQRINDVVKRRLEAGLTEHPLVLSYNQGAAQYMHDALSRVEKLTAGKISKDEALAVYEE